MIQYIAVFLFTGIMLVSGCANRWVSAPIHDDKRAKVILEYRQEWGKAVAQNYNHPYTIAPDDLERILNDMMFIEKVGMVEKALKDQKPEPVFQADESARLAPAIAEALAQATPDQRVHFQSLNRGGGLIFASRRITEGVVFAESSDQLNIAFNIINHELGADEPDEVPTEYKFREPTTVKESWTRILPPPSYSHLQQMDNEKTSEVWLVVDVNAYRNAPKEQAAPEPVVQPQETTPQPPPAEEKIAPAIEEPAATKPVEQPIAQPVVPSVDPAASKNEAIKNKLHLLKELFEDGLINEAEYEAEKKKILENLK
jgi:hypothetical protein